MIILPSKQVLLISASEQKELFMFDPKTTAVIHKYRDQSFLHPTLAYHRHSQQFIAPQNGKTFLSVWSTDMQQAELKVSLPECISCLETSKDGHLLIGGSANGNLYIWELPSGILIKKKAVHSSALLAIIEYGSGYIVTASKNQIKLWPYATLLIDSENAMPLKTYTSILDILGVCQNRSILGVLTQKSFSLLQLNVQPQQKQLQSIGKIEYQFATTLCMSKTSAFIGDIKGNIDVIDLIEDKHKEQLQFSNKHGDLQITHYRKKRRVLSSNNKQPVTCLAFLQTLAFLISGHVSGQVIIWSNYEIKKSIHLFKSAINILQVIDKPHDDKIPQQFKLKHLNKYEQSKQQELVQITPQNKQYLREQQWEQINDSEVLENMLQQIVNPERIMKEELDRLREEKKRLVEANLHYYHMFNS